MKKIDINILGLGNLGTAFFEGLQKNKNLNLYLYEENEKIRNDFAKLHNVITSPHINTLDSGVLILCIKPQNINNFFESFSKNIEKDVLICSPVAGLEIETINKYVKNRVIRIMPNLLIRKNNGFIPFVKNYDDDYLSFIEITLSSLGLTKEFTEQLFPLVTAELIKALPNLINTEDSFAELVNKVKSPKGTTEAGLDSLNDDSFDTIIFNAIQQATNRSIEISAELKNE